MGGAVDGGEAGGVDVGVALGRRQRGVPKSSWMVLRSPPAPKRWVAKEWRSGVRRHAFGEAEAAPDVTHALLHDGGIERAAAGADEEGLARTAGGEPRAGIAIGAQRLERLRQQRDRGASCCPCR